MESAKRSFAHCFKLQNKIPAYAGFDLRGETAKRNEVFGLGKCLRWKQSVADADFDEVKLIRAQGECLGIRSR